MKTLRTLVAACAALLGVASAAPAQIVVAPLAFASFKWDQRYTPPRSTFSSIVFTCQQPTPTPVIAMDDWLCTKQGPILRVSWWGWLRTPAQAQRPFYIAIYASGGANGCQPIQPPIYQTCVVPDQFQLVSKDCQFIPGTNSTHPIYYLSAKLPTPFTQTGTAAAPQHYWLQISEVDENSVQFGVEDFRWAGRRPIQVCPALQYPSTTGGFIQPLIDACDQQPDDLSFRLHSRTVIIVLNPNIPLPAVAGAATVRLYSPTDAIPGHELEVCSWSFGAGRTDGLGVIGNGSGGAGRFAMDFDSPDGDYIMEVDQPGCLPVRTPIHLQEGTEYTPSSFFDIFYGDLDSDGAVNTVDLGKLLSNFGKVTP